MEHDIRRNSQYYKGKNLFYWFMIITHCPVWIFYVFSFFLNLNVLFDQEIMVISKGESNFYIY